MTNPSRAPVQPALIQPVPLSRKGLPTQPLWIISILCALSAAAFSCGIAYLTGTIQPTTPAAQTVGAAVLLILLFYLFRILRKSRWMPFLIVAIGGFLCYVTGSFVLAAVWLSLLCAVGFSALLLAVADTPTLTRLAFIPLAAYGISLAISRDPALSLSALAPFPAAAALAFGTRASAARKDGPGRVGVICLTSLGLGVVLLGIAALLLSRQIGTLSPAHLRTWLDGVRISLSTQLVEVSRQLAEQIPQISSLSETQATDIINSAINVLPGSVVVAVNLCSALAQVILQGSLVAFGYESSVKGRVCQFRMSLVSSVVFLLSGILSMVLLFANNDTTLAETVAENIVMILHPGLALAGIQRFLYGFMRKGRGGCLPLIILLFIPFVVVYASILPAVYEAISAILGAILSRVLPPKDENNPWGSRNGTSGTDSRSTGCESDDDPNDHPDDDSDD